MPILNKYYPTFITIVGTRAPQAGPTTSGHPTLGTPVTAFTTCRFPIEWWGAGDDTDRAVGGVKEEKKGKTTKRDYIRRRWVQRRRTSGWMQETWRCVRQSVWRGHK